MRILGAGAIAALALLALSACQRSVPQEQYDQLSSELATAQAQFENARQRGEAAEGQVQAVQAQVTRLEQERPPDAEEVRTAAGDLFAAVGAALAANDTETFYGLMVAQLRERCTLEEVRAGLASGEASFPEVDVRAVYVDLEDHHRAVAQLAVPEEPEGMAGLGAALAVAFPWPIAREDGVWRFDLPSLFAFEGCPYGAADQPIEQTDGPWLLPEGETEVEMPWAVPPPATVPVAGVEPPRLEPPPGVNMPGAGSISGHGEASAYAVLETDTTLADLLEYYRRRTLKPDWVVQQETITEDLAALTWSFHDEAGSPWFGVLLVSPAGDRTRVVRVWMAGGSPELP